MCSAVIKFLPLAIICIVMIDGGLCHGNRKRQLDGSGTEPTTSTASGPTGSASGQSTFVNTGVPIIATAVGAIPSAAITCILFCYKQYRKRNARQSRDTTSSHAPDSEEVMGNVSSQQYPYQPSEESGESPEEASSNKNANERTPLLQGINGKVNGDVSSKLQSKGESTENRSRNEDPPECVARYAQYLKDKYKRMPTLPDGDWPPSLGNQYTQLVMIEQERELPGAQLVATMERDYIHGNIDNIVKRKKEIQLPEIFFPTEDGEQQLKILMDGAPGVGKSTLSRMVCKDWVSGKLLQQYHLIVLLPLRQTSIREANSIEDLIEADNPDLKQQVVQHIRETSGEHILLILDGYDELSNEERTQKSFFLDLVRGSKFPKCSVLVTSRPYASDYLQQLQSINRHVEVLGFTEEQIEQCIIKNTPDKTKATELLQMLKERQDLISLCYIPLNCAIVLYVYEKERSTLPHSLTKLYEIFVLNAVKRHANIIGNDPRSIRRLRTLAKLPMPLQQQLNGLSKLAYDGLVADRMVFNIDDLEAAFPDCSDLDIERSLLGLMTVFKGFTSIGQELSYHFLHLTIQEFLAAKWAASQFSASELLKFFQDHVREDRYRMVLLFLAGISQLSFSFAENVFSSKLDFEESAYTRMNTAKYFLFLSHLIYESQNFTLFHHLASTIVGAKLSAAWSSISPFDCLMLAHFLAWCDYSLKLLNLRGCGLTSQSLEIMHRMKFEHCGTTQIEEVDLSYNHPRILTKLSLLLKLPVFKQTRKLTVHGLQYPKRVSPDQVELHCLLNMRHLTTLEISVKKISNSNKMKYSLSLGKFLKVLENTSELKVLRYWMGIIDSKNAVDIFRSLEHNTSLEELDLSGSGRLAEGNSEAVGCAIEGLLNVNKTLKSLNLCACRLDTAVATHIADGLVHNASLGELNIGADILRGNKITSEGWVHLFRALCNNVSLKKLNITRNDLGMEGSVALAEMLSCNKSLTELNLDRSRIPEAGLQEIARGMLQNTSMQTLWVWPPKDKTFLEAEIERLKRSGNFKFQSSKKIEIKIAWLI